jgi:hypothetical protein
LCYWGFCAVVLAIPAERLEANGVRHLERLTAFKAHNAAKGLQSGVTNIPPPHVVERDDRLRFRSSTNGMTPEAQRRKANARHHSNPPGTIKIVLEAINRPGRSSAHRRKARFDGLFAIGWAERADRPFESCNFAHVVAIAGTNVVAP